jgi:hypothetical protein
MSDQGGASSSDIIRSLNDGGGILGAVIGSAASLALNRLVGSLVEIPASLLEGVSGRIKDSNKAHSEMRSELNRRAIEQYASDPEQVERAAVRLLGKSIRKQRNIEAIAEETVLLLTNDPPAAETIGPSDEFLDNFEELAENANTTDLRAWFAKILAGECRKPGSYSKTTLNVMRLMDSNLANDLREIKKRVIFCTSILRYSENGPEDSTFLDRITNLASYGVVGSISIIRHAKAKPNLVKPFSYCGYALIPNVLTEKEVKIPAYPLTRTGEELLTLVEVEPDRPAAIHAGRSLISRTCFDEMWISDVVTLPNGEESYDRNKMLKL